MQFLRMELKKEVLNKQNENIKETLQGDRGEFTKSY